MTAMPRGRPATILLITAGYALTWATAVAVWLLIATLWSPSSEEGPEFDWSGVVLGLVVSLVALIGGHVVWAKRTVVLLGRYGHPWRAALTVVAPPVSLVLVVIARNESLVPWQLWPVALVAVPAIASAWATARP
jgi:multisubunit Na+/H+ antiporter MnhE subunit